MEKSRQFQEVLDLGKTLAQEFSDHGRIDVTTSWMAHYLSEIMVRVENARNDEKKSAIQKECADIILELWKRRVNYADRIGPLRGLEHAVSVIKALRDEDTNPLSWRRFSGYEDDTEWGKFIRQTRESMENILRLSLATVANKQLIMRQKKWLKHEAFLTDDEKRILRYLDELLDASSSPIRIVIVGENEDQLAEKPDKMSQIFNKLSEFIYAQEQALENLKKQVMSRERAKVRNKKHPAKKAKKETVANKVKK